MQGKKNILTYEGLRKYESELEELKVVRRQEVAQKSKKQENRAICPRMQNMMQQRMNSAT